MEKKIAVIKGDGIGPDVVEQAMEVLDKVCEKHGHKFVYTEVLAGGASLDKYGVPLTDEIVKVCKASDAVLLGAMGGPKWDTLPGNLRPEAGLLSIRNQLGLFANLRPAVMYQELSGACPLKEAVTGTDGLDFVVVRELTGGAYFGKRDTGSDENGMWAYDTMFYTENEIRRIVKVGFELAMKRDKRLTSVDKANVLDSSRLWRKITLEVAKDYPEVRLNHLYVDNCAMQLVINPRQFDVIVTENLFGDIISDESSMITGSIGMLPSASMGNTTFGMYEPIHGSAPDIAGQDKANPIATILSVAMMLRLSFGLDAEAAEIEAAVKKVLEEGYRTGDIMSEGKTLVGTKEMGKLVRDRI